MRAQARPEQYHRALSLLQEAGGSALLSARNERQSEIGDGQTHFLLLTNWGCRHIIECLIVTQVSVGQDGILRALAAGAWGDSEALDIGHYSVEKC